MGTNYDVEIPGASEPVHLGKMSAGWVFLFRAQPAWDDTNAFSSWVHLATMGPITDEYGRHVEFHQLLQDVVYSYMRQDSRRHGYDELRPVYTNHGFQFCLSDFS